ncbi:MAG: hypothetical protein IT445_12710 [Phycisphaeraceae bacterium]|nr:hypothetical protein [Phycisphaeraceae bacterium]
MADNEKLDCRPEQQIAGASLEHAAIASVAEESLGASGIDATEQPDIDVEDTTDYDHQLYDVYQEERRHLTQSEGTFDLAITTAVLTISGGALGISLTLVKDFDVVEAAATSYLLATAWVLLVLALLGSLVSLKVNQETHSRFRTILDEECAHGLDGAFERARARQTSCWLRRLLRFTDWASVTTCLVGTALLFTFVYSVVANGDTKNGTAPAATTTATAATPDSTTATASTSAAAGHAADHAERSTVGSDQSAAPRP